MMNLLAWPPPSLIQCVSSNATLEVGSGVGPADARRPARTSPAPRTPRQARAECVAASDEREDGLGPANTFDVAAISPEVEPSRCHLLSSTNPAGSHVVSINAVMRRRTVSGSGECPNAKQFLSGCGQAPYDHAMLDGQNLPAVKEIFILVILDHTRAGWRAWRDHMVPL